MGEDLCRILLKIKDQEPFKPGPKLREGLCPSGVVGPSLPRMWWEEDSAM